MTALTFVLALATRPFAKVARAEDDAFSALLKSVEASGSPWMYRPTWPRVFPRRRPSWARRSGRRLGQRDSDRYHHAGVEAPGQARRRWCMGASKKTADQIL